MVNKKGSGEDKISEETLKQATQIQNLSEKQNEGKRELIICVHFSHEIAVCITEIGLESGRT